MKITPCMGGFCGMRQKCLHHKSPSTRVDPAERLCSPGREREMFFMDRVPAEQAIRVTHVYGRVAA